jgi:hypothetical protein
MKNLLFVLLFLPLIAFGQEQPQDLFETVNIHVKKGQEKALEAAVKAHNAKFHPEDGNFHARLFYNINGPSGGTYSWIMGPTSWTAMDSRPTDGDHDADWKKVTALVDKFDSPHYWKYSPKLSSDGGNASPAKRLIWIYDIKRGQAKRWSELVGKVKQVYAEKRPTEPFWVLWNEFGDSKAGMDAAFIFAFDNWSWMDRQSKFSKDFEEVHGEGSWFHFMNEFRETVDGRVDFIRERID